MSPAAHGAPRPSVSAVLPAYNEAAVIAETVRRTLAALEQSGLPGHEVLVIDDGSVDGTAARATAAVDRGAPLRVISHPVNRGYGASLRTGFDAAGCEAIFVMDSDGQFDPDELSRLLEGYAPDRVLAGYRIRRNDTLLRRLYNAAFFLVVRMLVGATVRDVNCAFKLFPAQVGRGLRADGAVISTELLVRARRAGYELVDVGVHHFPRTTGKATGASVHVVLRAFTELWGLRRDWRLDGLAPLR